jgi:hypothetical protein
MIIDGICVSVDVGEGTTPLILPWNQIDMSDQIHTLGPLLLGKDVPLPVQQRAGWAPETVWTFRSRQKSVVPAQIRTFCTVGYKM